MSFHHLIRYDCRVRVLSPSTVNSPESSPPPTRRELIRYSLGSLAAGLPAGSIQALTYPVFNMVLGVSPGFLGTVGAIAKIWDALMDPLMGYVSDRTKSRWGRRRPYLLVGGCLTAIVTALFFQVGADWAPRTYLAWYLILSLLFLTTSTIFTGPYYALGIEIATDYDQRTRVVAYRSVVEKISGIVNQWVFRFMELFPGSILGAKILGFVLGGIGAAAALVVFTGTHERFSTGPNRRNVIVHESLWRSIANILSNHIYRRLLLVWVIMTLNIGLFGTIGLYLNVYYVFGGDKAAGATLSGVVGSLGLALSLVAIPLTAFLCRKLGKHRVLDLALWLYIAGSGLKWFCVNPHHPWLQLVLPVFFSIGISSVFVVMSSMQADIVDMDELEHGGRREGMFGAVGGWVMKLGGALALALSGWIIVLTGFDVNNGAAQPDGVFLRMRILFSLAPMLGSFLALLLLRNYPLTRERSEEIRTALELRRSQPE